MDKRSEVTPHIDEQYFEIVNNILSYGTRTQNRTGIDAFTYFGGTIRHDMSQGFPLLTTKKMFTRGIFGELEWFISGNTDKNWLRDRNIHIWDDWCSKEIIPYGNNEETKAKMKDERDLGPVYGFQWRHFGAKYNGWDKDYSGQGVDQLANAIDELKRNPSSRKVIVSAWNPVDIPKMALEPCHYAFHLDANDGRLNLSWAQRSVDVPCGLPFNIASYAKLQTIIAKQLNLSPGILFGELENVHIYENQIDGIKTQLTREPRDLPTVNPGEFETIFDWSHKDVKVFNYYPHDKIVFPIAV